MSSFHNLSHVLVALPYKLTIHIPSKLATRTWIVETTASIDYGATENVIHINLLTKAKFPLKHLPKSILACI